MDSPRPNQADAIAALKGQTLRVPDLKSLFSAWPSPGRINPLHAELQRVVDGTIRRIAASQGHVERRLRDDIALLTCAWFPDAAWPELEALGLFTVWLVCWDDTVDANEGDLAASFDAAEAWRRETAGIARTSLALDGDGDGEPADVDLINAALWDSGQRLVASGVSLAQRQWYLDELCFFIDSAGKEQKLRLEGKMLDYDAYMELRLGTVGIGILSALVEYATQQPLPPAAVQSAHGKALARHASVLASLLNDMLSLKKELSTDCVLNAVASLLAPGRTLDEVVGEIYGKMHESVVALNVAAAGLAEEVQGDADMERAVAQYIQGHRAIVTGTLEFSLISPRYNISKLLRQDGSLEVIL